MCKFYNVYYSTDLFIVFTKNMNLHVSLSATDTRSISLDFASIIFYLRAARQRS